MMFTLAERGFDESSQLKESPALIYKQRLPWRDRSMFLRTDTEFPSGSLWTNGK